MTQSNSDTVPESGTGTDADRLSQSPQEIRNSSADPYHDPSPVQTNAGKFNYDKNDLPTGVELPPFAPSHCIRASAPHKGPGNGPFFVRWSTGIRTARSR